MADRTDEQEKRTNLLITVESILVGFLVAYAAIFNQTLVSLDNQPLFGTVLAALLVYALAVTAFRSILLLYRSTGVSINSKKPSTTSSLDDFDAGYELFLMVVVGSTAYVLMNAVSIVHYAWKHSNVFFAHEHLSIIGAACIFTIWILLIVIFPRKFTWCVRRARRWFGNRAFGLLIFLGLLLIGEAIYIIQPMIPESAVLQTCYSRLLSIMSEWIGFLTTLLFVATVAGLICVVAYVAKRRKKI